MIDELVLADPKLPRFVYWEGKLYALPGALQDLVKFDLLTCNIYAHTFLFLHQFRKLSFINVVCCSLYKGRARLEPVLVR